MPLAVLLRYLRVFCLRELRLSTVSGSHLSDGRQGSVPGEEIIDIEIAALQMTTHAVDDLERFPSLRTTTHPGDQCVQVSRGILLRSISAVWRLCMYVCVRVCVCVCVTRHAHARDAAG